MCAIHSANRMTCPNAQSLQSYRTKATMTHTNASVSVKDVA